jgi:lipopolysaccharide export LptBFGC system permease protein LptF
VLSGPVATVLPVAIVLAAVAAWLQWSARSSFTATRATGIACAVLTPLTLVTLDAMF